MTGIVTRRTSNEEFGPIDEVRAGLDWISCTLTREASHYWTWQNECLAVVREIAEQGHTVTDFGLNGYRGIISGGSFVGQRDDSGYVQLSGANAQTYYRRIARGDLHISRLDLAVTVKYARMPQQLGTIATQAAFDADRKLMQGRHRKIWYMSGSDGGYTLYIGSPSSDQRARLYNKEVQSGTPEYAHTWRYEVVFRNNRAMAHFESICAVGEDYAPELVRVVVGTWFEARGVSIEWEAAHMLYTAPVLAVNPTDAQKKLRWLAAQVKPAVRWLIEHGYTSELEEALEIGISAKTNERGL